MLEKTYRAAFYCSEDHGYQEFPADTQFVLFDAYRSGDCLKWSQLEKMCDGTYIYPSKGGAQCRLKEPTLIIMSNCAPENVYTKCWDAIQYFFEARFVVTEIQSMVPDNRSERVHARTRENSPEPEVNPWSFHPIV